MKFKHFVPLLIFIIPTIILTVALFVLTEPPPPIQLAGLVCLLIGACFTYYSGVKAVLKETGQEKRSAGS